VIDIGINFTDKVFSKDLPECILSAHAADVTQMIVTGTDIEGSQQAAQLAEAHPESLYSTAGVHPHHAKDWQPSDYESLKKLAQSDNVVAIGEAGLDFNRDFSPRADQEKVFEQHIELAIETGKPMFLHERDAFERFHPIIKQYRDSLSSVVVHCFTGSKEALFAYLDLDLHIGITGWVCDERRGQHLLPLISEIPEHRLMIETDAPYLLPRNIRPKPKSRNNEPAYLPWVVEKLSECTGKSIEQIASQTTLTSESFFRLNNNLK